MENRAFDLKPSLKQNARQALENNGYVLVQGANAVTGTGKEPLADSQMRKSFFGGVINMRWFIIAAFLPTPLLAEGAVQSWFCGLNRLCHSDGQCIDTSNVISFIIEPVTVGPEGAGDYTIKRGDDTYPMHNVTGLGPLIWSEQPGDREVLLFTGGDTFLWQRFKAETGTSDIGFLTCEVMQ